MDSFHQSEDPVDISRILHNSGSPECAEREKRRLDQAPLDHVDPSELARRPGFKVYSQQSSYLQPKIVHTRPDKILATSHLAESRQQRATHDDTRKLDIRLPSSIDASISPVESLQNASEFESGIDSDYNREEPSKFQQDEAVPEWQIIGCSDKRLALEIPTALSPPFRHKKGAGAVIDGNLLAPMSIVASSSPRGLIQPEEQEPQTSFRHPTVSVSKAPSDTKQTAFHNSLRDKALSRFTDSTPVYLLGQDASGRNFTRITPSSSSIDKPVSSNSCMPILVRDALKLVSANQQDDPIACHNRNRISAKLLTNLTTIGTAAKLPTVSISIDDHQEEETMTEFKNRLTCLLRQMMFVSGETAEASAETTWMIEEIVREQVLEMLKEATILANRRGSKSISIVDLIFQIRHNPAKVSRLKTFLSWKDVRKNVKDSDDKAGGADADALDLEDAAGPGANPSAPQKSIANKKAKLILPWEVQSFYSEQVPEREDEEDEEEEEQNEATLARLASADERTRNMTRKEYVYWSECRQASFTFRKGKRFREWAGFGTIIDSKPNDDVVDILGFLTFEIVQTLTEEALKVKNAEDSRNKKASIGRGEEASKKRKREGCTLFEMPEEGRTPVEPRHVREAFRILQIVPSKYKFMRQGYAGIRTPLRMI